VPRQRETLRRLFGYSRPYRGRLVWAMAGMIVYGAGTAGLAALIKPIVDNGLLSQQGVGLVAWSVVGVFFLKGIGSYVSSYLMSDVGLRVVMDMRNQLYRHILDQSAGFFAHGATGKLLSLRCCSTTTRASRWSASPARR
jgi:subfamily B ATP-binding cassette protein MsbA